MRSFHEFINICTTIEHIAHSLLIGDIVRMEEIMESDKRWFVDRVDNLFATSI